MTFGENLDFSGGVNLEFCEKGGYGRANRVGLIKIIRRIIFLPKMMKSLIINGPIDGSILKVCKVGRVDLSGPIEFLIMVFFRISRKLIAILLRRKSFLKL